MSEIRMREPCPKCRSMEGTSTTKGLQDVIRCAVCDAWVYNRPKDESGRERVSVSSSRIGLKPKDRTRILDRDNARCCYCGRGPAEGAQLDVGHVLSVDAAKRAGMTARAYNSDENLATECKECNLGRSSIPVPARLLVAIIMARLEGNG